MNVASRSNTGTAPQPPSRDLLRSLTAAAALAAGVKRALDTPSCPTCGHGGGAGGEGAGGAGGQGGNGGNGGPAGGLPPDCPADSDSARSRDKLRASLAGKNDCDLPAGTYCQAHHIIPVNMYNEDVGLCACYAGIDLNGQGDCV